MIDLLKPKKHANEFRMVVKKTKKRSCLFCKSQTTNKIELSHGIESCCRECKNKFDSVKSSMGEDDYKQGSKNNANFQTHIKRKKSNGIRCLQTNRAKP